MRYLWKLFVDVDGTVYIWEGEAANGTEAEELALQAHPGGTVKAGQEIS